MICGDLCLQTDYLKIDLDSLSVKETQGISFHRQSRQTTQTLATTFVFIWLSAQSFVEIKLIMSFL